MSQSSGQSTSNSTNSVVNPTQLAGYEDFVERFGSPARSLSPVSSATASQISSAQSSLAGSPTKLRAAKKSRGIGVSASKSGTESTRSAARRAKYDVSVLSDDFVDDDEEDLSSFSHDEDNQASKSRLTRKGKQKGSKLRKTRSFDDSKSQSASTLFSPGVTDFHRACQFGHISSLESMFRKGEVFDVDAMDALHNTGLHEACINGHWEVVRLLLKHGANLDVKNLAGKTPLDFSRTPSLTAFINEFKMRSIISKDHFITHLIWQQQQSKIVPFLKDQQSESDRKALVNDKDGLGFSPLHAAAIFDRPEVIKALLKYGASINAVSATGISPLHDACRFSSAGSIKCLLEAGADPHVRNASGHKPFTMCNKPLRRLFRRTLKETGVEDFDVSEPETWIHFEEPSDQSDSEEGSHSDSESVEDAKAPLYGGTGGVSREERKLQQMLAIMNKMSPAKKGPSTSTKKRPRVPREVDDEDEERISEPSSTPRRQASRREQPAAKKPKELDANFVDKSFGTTLLHKHAGKGNLKEVKRLTKANKKLVKLADNAGYTALHEAALNGHLPVVKFLLESGADIDHAAVNGDTPLHDSAENGHIEVVSFLLQAGANRIVKNVDGNTAYDVANSARIRSLLETPDKRSSAPTEGRKSKRELAALEAAVAVKAPPKPKAEKVKREPSPPVNPETLGALLLVRVGEPNGWYFLSPQIETLYRIGKPTSTANAFKSRHKHLYSFPLSSIQRQHLISAQTMKRLGDLQKILSDSSLEAFMLEKDAVYAVFNQLGLSFGNINVIYLDLQRILRSSLADDSLLSGNTASTSSCVVPPKLKMKMQRKGSNAGVLDNAVVAESTTTADLGT